MTKDRPRRSRASDGDVAAMLLARGQALEIGDRWGEALRCYQRADLLLQPYARVTADHVRRLRVKVARALIGVNRALGRYRDADAHGRRALRLAERSFGRRDLDVAGALNDLGMLRKYQGRYAEALPLYRRALEILRAAGLGRSADAASLFHNLGGVEHARGRYARAEPPARLAVTLRETLLGPRDPAVAADLGALAAIVAARGRHAEAAGLYRRA